MELDTARIRAVTITAESISMSATHAVLFGLLHRAFNALRVGMQVETRVFPAITGVHDLREINTARADLVSRRGVVLTAKR